MQRSANAKSKREAGRSDSTRKSESGIRRRSELHEDIGAIQRAFAESDGALLWLIAQPSRCANDAGRFAMTINCDGIVLRCPRCQSMAAWRAPDTDGFDDAFGQR